MCSSHQLDPPDTQADNVEGSGASLRVAEGSSATAGYRGMSFDLTDLRLFLHVAEAGSITRGAEKAHLALASASERIRSLEESLA